MTPPTPTTKLASPQPARPPHGAAAPRVGRPTAAPRRRPQPLSPTAAAAQRTQERLFARPDGAVRGRDPPQRAALVLCREPGGRGWAPGREPTGKTQGRGEGASRAVYSPIWGGVPCVGPGDTPTRASQALPTFRLIHLQRGSPTPPPHCPPGPSPRKPTGTNPPAPCVSVSVPVSVPRRGVAGVPRPRAGTRSPTAARPEAGGGGSSTAPPPEPGHGIAAGLRGHG